jgi:hypothetical protein
MKAAQPSKDFRRGMRISADNIEHLWHNALMKIFKTLRKALRESDRSLRSIASEAQISPSLLCRVQDGTRGVSLERAERVFRALGYELTIDPIQGNEEE